MTFCQITNASATRMAILVLTIATAFALAACSPVLRAHGYTPSEEDLAVIEVGVATEDNVAAAVGTPAFVSGTGAKGWYYLSSTVQSYAYEHPEVTNRRLVAISFDENGTVTNIERFGLEDGRVIALNRRVTDVAVESPGLIRQLLGNIGSITADDLSDGS